MSTYLVTGAAGFIGSAIADKLLKKGHSVVTIDNFSTGKRSNIPDECILIENNCQNPEILSDLSQFHFDAILHIAGQSSGEISFENPIYDLQTNTQSTLLLLDYARKIGCNKFIYASSMSVYGDQLNPFVNELVLPSPKSFYAVGKLASEQYMKIYANYGIQSTALRFFNIYGAGQNLENLKQGMISIYLAQAMDNHHIVIKGTGDRFRDFVYIDDAVSAVLLALERSGNNFEIYNVSSCTKTTVSDVVTMIKKLLPYSISVKYTHGTPGDQHGVYGDNSKIKNDLGWEPSVNFEEGMRMMVSWAKNYRT